MKASSCLCIPDACFYLVDGHNTITKECKTTLANLCMLGPNLKLTVGPSVLTMKGLTVENGYVMCHASSES